MATKSKKLSVRDGLKTSTESPKKKLKQKEKILSTKSTTPTDEEPFPLHGTPTNDIENAKVTLEEKNYERLRKIEMNLKQLFREAESKGYYVGMGKNKKLPETKEAQEGHLVKLLRGLVGL